MQPGNKRRCSVRGAAVIGEGKKRLGAALLLVGHRVLTRELRGIRDAELPDLAVRESCDLRRLALDDGRDDGRDVVLWIGGPDGLDAALRSSADESLRLSDLTLPHALARVLLAEALYRAWSVLAGHPYHRE